MNPVAEKFADYLSKLREEQKDSGWLKEAILEIERLEGLLLESRMQIEAYEIELRKKNNPVPGKLKANAKRLDDLFKAMKI